jgi:hypothetical protein
MLPPCRRGRVRVKPTRYVLFDWSRAIVRANVKEGVQTFMCASNLGFAVGNDVQLTLIVNNNHLTPATRLRLGDKCYDGELSLNEHEVARWIYSVSQVGPH